MPRKNKTKGVYKNILISFILQLAGVFLIVLNILIFFPASFYFAYKALKIGWKLKNPHKLIGIIISSLLISGAIIAEIIGIVMFILFTFGIIQV